MKVKKAVDEQGRFIGYSFHCPGCLAIHTLPVRPIPAGEVESPETVGLAHWHFNGDLNSPTFSPSVSVKCGHYCDPKFKDCWCDYYSKHPEEEPEFACFICHSFVRNGQIEFLHDCTHAKAGQTIPLTDIKPA